MTKPNLPPAATTHMAAAAVLCYEEQNLPQSAGSHTIGTPPPSTEITGGLRGPAAHLHDSIKIRIQCEERRQQWYDYWT